jgi:uncharacterized protein YcfJ
MSAHPIALRATCVRHRSMVATALAGCLLLSGVPLARAQSAEMGRVISSVPVMQQVAVPRQVCHQEQVVTPGQKSGAGAVMGGIAGGAIGNQIGDGSGRAVATVIGLVGGAMLGNRLESGGAPQTQTVQRCHTQTVYETQAVGYQVTYEYAGRQYTVQMPQDPGPYVRLQVTPMPATSAPVYGPQSGWTTPMVGSGTTIIRQETHWVPAGPAAHPHWRGTSHGAWQGHPHNARPWPAVTVYPQGARIAGTPNEQR